MLNSSASLAMSTCVLKALPGKLDIKRHSPSILYSDGHSLLSTTLKFRKTNKVYDKKMLAKFLVSTDQHLLLENTCLYIFKI